MSLQSYISQEPGLRLDFLFVDKRGNNPNLFPIICSFLNTEGGIIIMGLNIDKESQGLTKQDIDEFKVFLAEKSEGHKGYLNPSKGLYVSEFKEGSDYYLIIRVPKSQSIHMSGENYYIREGSDSVALHDPEKIQKLFLTRRENTESEIIHTITKDDLDMGILSKVRTLASSIDSNHRWLTQSDDEILSGSQLAKYDRIEARWKYKLAAVLILGKDETISRVLPGYKMDIFVRRKNLDRWDDRKVIITNLIDTRIIALDFIKGYYPEMFYDDGDQRIDLRDRIFREIVGNIIVHREYTDALSSEIVIGPHNLVATNPNNIRNRGHLDLVRFEHYPKNPIIRKFFNDLGWSDEAGSGVRNVTNFLKIYAKGSIPEFIEDNPFRTIIPTQGYVLGERVLVIYGLLGLSSEMAGDERNTLIKELPTDKELQQTKDDSEFIKVFIGTLMKNERKLSGVIMLKKSVMETSETKTDGTYSQIGVNLLTKKGRNLLKTLIGLTLEMTLEDIMLFVGFESKESFRSNYLNILRNNGLITLTNPDLPNDPNQKYLITERGIKLMSGIEI